MQKVDTNQIWKDDILDRQKFGTFLSKLIEVSDEAAVFNLDSKWGTGKTFFLDRWHKDISESHPSVYFNAWETDYIQEPITAFTRAFHEQLLCQSEEIADKDRAKKIHDSIDSIFKVVLPTVFKGLAQRYIGEEGTDAFINLGSEEESNIASGAENIAKALVRYQKEAGNAVEEFKDALAGLVPLLCKEDDKKGPLIVIIDELDRCRPSFAIQLLEQIKHFFSIDGVIFVMATDSEQLAASICSVYGDGFDSETYLRRFFDATFTFPSPKMTKFVESIFSQRVSNWDWQNKLFPYVDPDDPRRISSLLVGVVTAFYLLKLTLRDQEQCLQKFSMLLIEKPKGEVLHHWWLFLLICTLHRNPEEFRNLVQGQSASWFDQLFGGIPELHNTGLEMDDLREYKAITRCYLALHSDTSEAIRDRAEKQKENDSLFKPASLEQKAARTCVQIARDYSSLRKYASDVKTITQIVR